MRTFEMNGKSYTTLTAIAKELGVKRVYTRDFAKYGIKETTDDVVVMKSVNILDTQDEVSDVAVDALDQDANNQTAIDVEIDSTDLVDADTVDAGMNNPLTTGGSAIIFAHATTNGIAVDKVIDIPTDEAATDEAATDEAATDEAATDEAATDEAATDEAATDDPQANTKSATTKKLTEDELIAQIERDVVDYADATELSQNLKKISLNGLVKMAENVQVDTWERMTNVGIRKMRVIMELKKAYFPTQPTRTNASTGPSPWKKIPTADLQATATAKGLSWKDCANNGILRMRLIMELKKAGVTADDFKK